MKRFASVVVALALAISLMPAVVLTAMPSQAAADEAAPAAPQSIEGASVTAMSPMAYTGHEVKPKPVVNMGGKRLVENADYTLSYDNNINAGKQAIVFVDGIGNYTGRTQAFFEIAPTQIATTTASLTPVRIVYDGTEKTPAVTLKLGDITLVDGPDYYIYPVEDNVNAGLKTLRVYGEGNFTGIKPVSYTIEPAPISSVSLSDARLAYTGLWQEPIITVEGAGKVLKEWTDYTIKYLDDCTSVGKKRLAITGCNNFTGTIETSFEIVPEGTPDVPSRPTEPPRPDGTTNPDTQMMYRAYNPNSGEHFYTAHYAEVEDIVSKGWNYEGEAWVAPKTSATPVYRLYSGTDHHYTTSEVERDHLISVGWNDEGIGWYSDDAKGVGLHRLFNPNVDPNAERNNSGSHHYTTSDVEKDDLVSRGWQYEDFGWYGVK